MNCSESEVLIHALLDGELDAGHSREVEAHLAACANCTAKLAAFRQMRQAMTDANLREKAPDALRRRIEAALPAPGPAAEVPSESRVIAFRPSRRSFFGGFAAGAVLSSAIAATLLVAVVRDDQAQRITGEVVSAHLRSLQGKHLTDVETSDQHTVKPWFNGKLDVAPPVIDLTAQGFTLIGGRLDDVNGEAAAAIVYRRREHVINLFIAANPGADHPAETSETRHGFNVRHWTEGGLAFWAVSDINAAELKEFCEKLKAAMPASPSPS